jgi:predicted RNA-binding protein associated with RNAse of E/G family
MTKTRAQSDDELKKTVADGQIQTQQLTQAVQTLQTNVQRLEDHQRSTDAKLDQLMNSVNLLVSQSRSRVIGVE